MLRPAHAIKKTVPHALAVALMGVMVSGCGEWSNWVKTEKVTPEYLGQPESASDLVKAVTEAKKRDMRVRMTGSGHSASDVAITKDVLMTPEKLNKPLELDRSRLKTNYVNDPSLVRVMSGIKIKDLNDFLDSQGRALTNMGGYDGQTIAGVFMTATHGSGLDFGPMADEIQSLQMVVANGKMVQIEPTNGITDPSKFSGYLEENSSIPVELIQDDKTFNAAKVAIGSMGIVYSYVINTDEKFWLREVRKVTTWSELKKPGGPIENLINGLPPYGDQASPEHWELQFSPFPDEETGEYNMLVTERWHSYTPLPEQKPSERGQPGADFTSNLAVALEMPIAGILDTFPSLSKFLLKTALETQADDNYTNVSYNVFNIGVINYTPAIGIETAIDINDAVESIEKTFATSQALLEEGVPQTSPIALRFVKSSDSLIATQQGRNTMFTEVIGLLDGKNVMKLMKKHQDDQIKYMGARPHWGLDLNYVNSEAELRAMYPKWDEWKSVYTRFNDGTFDGKVTDRLGISVKPR